MLARALAVAIAVTVGCPRVSAQRVPPSNDLQQNRSQPDSLSPRSASGGAASGRVALSVSGGVSLGSYQAGATWAFIFVLQHADAFAALRSPGRRVSSLRVPNKYQLDVITGASAGNINGLAAAVQYCDTAASTNPYESVFEQIWIPIGFDDLIHDPIDSAQLGIFSRGAFEAAWNAVYASMDRRQHTAACDLLLGDVVTKLTPDTISIVPGLTIPLQHFAGLFRVIGDTGSLSFILPRHDDLLHASRTDILLPAAPGSIQLRIDSIAGEPVVRLPHPAVRQIVEASGAFPVFFASREVWYETPNSIGWDATKPMPWLCHVADTAPPACLPAARHAQYVDGGLFENRPLNLALDLVRSTEDALTRSRSTALKQSQDSLQSLALAVIACRPKNEQFMRIDHRLASAISELQVVQYRLQDTTQILRGDSTMLLGARQSTLERDIGGMADTVRAVLDSVQLTEARCGAQKDILSALNRSVQQLAGRTSGPRLFYFISSEATRTVDIARSSSIPSGNSPGLSKSSPDSAARAGIGSALAVVTTSFETGQNSEIRYFKNRLEDLNQPDRRFSLGINTRFPPLMGESVDHFGAFFAKTFREYDFYAGVYDGLRSGFRELYCRSADSVGGASIAGTCEGEWLRAAIEHRVITLSPSGQALIARFGRYEQLDIPAPPDTAGERAKSAVLLALADANMSVLRSSDSSCATHAIFVDGLLCEARMPQVLTAWARNLKESGVLDSLCHQSSVVDRPACKFASDPRAAFHLWTLTVLTREQGVEDVLEHTGATNHAMLVGLPLYFERAFNEQYRSCWQAHNLPCVDLNPTTTDVLNGRMRSQSSRLLPVSVGRNWSNTASWAEWRPTVYLARVGNARGASSFAVMTPVEALDIRGSTHLAAGVGATVMPQIPRLASLSAVSISGLWWRSSHRTHLLQDFTTAWFAGIVRFGYRTGLAEPKDGGRRKAFRSLTFGLGDVNGLSARLIRRVYLSIAPH